MPFKDGPGSAHSLEVAFNHSRDFEGFHCWYRNPHVRCRGLIRYDRSDTYLRVTVTVHKTAPKVGYYVACTTFLGVCRREPIPLSQ